MISALDQRPWVVAVSGPDGAGKTTFYHAHLKAAGLRFVNADVLANELDMEPYAAARVAGTLRSALVEQGESFVFETVFSDPVGDKLAFLRDAAARGYTVILCFIGISGPELSEQRVAMRGDACLPRGARRASGQARHPLPARPCQSPSRHPRTAECLGFRQ
jgi:predicted ABC-type ATPase